MEFNTTIQSVNQMTGKLPVGAFAKLAAAGGRLYALRHNNLLRKDEWKQIDDALIQVASEPLPGLDDIFQRNLIQRLGGIGTLISEYERLFDMGPASVSMDADTPPREDTPKFDLVGVPVPFISHGFRISARRLLASRQRGDAIDVIGVQQATRKVRERTEQILFNGIDFTIDGNKVHGYLNHPDAGTLSASTVPGVASSGVFSDIDNIYPVTNFAIGKVEDDLHYGPFVIYVSTFNFKQFRAVYDDGSGQTALERCVDKIPGLEDIKPSHQVPAGQMVVVQMTSGVVDMAVAEEPMTIPWDSMGGLVDHFLVAACWVPRVKSEGSGKSGILVVSGLGDS